jgi:formylglycine-generating enzyme required for sulfatase activity
VKFSFKKALVLLSLLTCTLLMQVFSASTQNSGGISFSAQEKTAPIRVLASPAGVADGENATLSLLDPTNLTILQQWTIRVADEALLLPEGLYSVDFPYVDGYDIPGDEEDEGNRFFLKSSSSEQVITGNYETLVGAIRAEFFVEGTRLQALEGVRLVLKNEKGQKETYPKSGRNLQFDEESQHYYYQVDNLLAGRYQVEFLCPEGVFHQLSKRKVLVQRAKVSTLEQLFIPHLGGLEVGVQAGEGVSFSKIPDIGIENSDGEIVATGKHGNYISKSLMPGKYRLVFEVLEGLEAPDPIDVQVQANQVQGPFTALYQLSTGSLQVSYEALEFKHMIGSAYFVLVDEVGDQIRYPKEGMQTNSLEGGAQLVNIEGLKTGTYSAYFQIDGMNEIFAATSPIRFDVKRNEKTNLDYKFEPLYSSLTIKSLIPEKYKNAGDAEFILVDSEKRAIFESRNGSIEAEKILPGTYTIVFSEISSALVAPQSIQVQLSGGLSPDPIVSVYEEATGSVIVNYDTGRFGKRLDRVRFWLTDSQGDRMIFPKETPSASGGVIPQMQAIVEALPVGEYTLSIVVPNEDDLFITQSDEKIEIFRDHVTTLEKSVVPNYASVHVQALPTSENQRFKYEPVITLRDEENQIVASSTGADLYTDQLLPGRYSVHFGVTEGFKPPMPKEIELSSAQILETVLGEYRCDGGDAVIVYSTGKEKYGLNELSFTLVDANGGTLHFPKDGQIKEDSVTGGLQVSIEDLFPGEYQLKFNLPTDEGVFDEAAPQAFAVVKGETSYLRAEFEPNYAEIEVRASLPERLGDTLAYIGLTNEEGDVLSFSKGDSLVAMDLLPGKYKVVFGNIDGTVAPETIPLTLKAGQSLGPIVKEYDLERGNLDFCYSTGLGEEYLDDVQVRLVEEETGEVFSLDFASLERLSSNEMRAIVSGLPSGVYQLKTSVPSMPQLFTESINQRIMIHHEQTTACSHDLIPEYGEVQATAVGPYGLESKGACYLVYADGEHEGNIAFTSHVGEMAIFNRVVPGKYYLRYEKIPGFNCPLETELFVHADEKMKPIFGEYTPMKGNLTISASVEENTEFLRELRMIVTNEQGDEFVFPRNGFSAAEISDSVATVILEDMPLGKYSISFESTETQNLFKELPTREVVIEGNDDYEVFQWIKINTGSIEVRVTAKEMDSRKLAPGIVLKDTDGITVASSLDADLQVNDLLPGTYTISFLSSEYFDAPDDVTIKVPPGGHLGPIIASATRTKEDLVVNYSTGEAQYRLDRIRFWLIGSDGSRSMYPSSDNFEDDVFTGYRSVTINDLPTDDYTIEFLLPNSDRAFQEISPLAVEVKKGASNVIIQDIEMRYARVNALARTSHDDLIEDEKIWISINTPDGKTLEKKNSRELCTDALLSGDYVVTFAAIEGFEKPRPVPITVVAGESLDPIVHDYIPLKGAVLVSYSTDTLGTGLEGVRFIIENSEGVVGVFPEGNSFYDNDVSGLRKVLVGDLLPGSYQLRFLVYGDVGLFDEIDPIDFKIESDELTYITEKLNPQFGKLSVDLRFDEDKENVGASSLKLIRLDDDVEIVLEDLPYEFNRLVPADYLLVFSDIEGYITPKTIEIALNPPCQHEKVNGTYKRAKGSLKLTCDTGDYRKGFEKLELVLTDKTGEIGKFSLNENERSFLIDDIPTDEYTAHLIVANSEGLFDTPKAQVLTIEKGQETSIEYSLNPHYVTIEVEASISQIKASFPTITIYDENQKIVHSEMGLSTTYEKALPGNYQIVFSDEEDLDTPPPVHFTANAGEHLGPFKGNYRSHAGSMVIKYQTGKELAYLEDVNFLVKDTYGQILEFDESEVSKVLDEKAGGMWVRIDSLPVGDYEVTLVPPNEGELFQSVPSRLVTVVKDQTSTVSEQFNPSYARLEVSYTLPEKAKAFPKITLYDQDENIVSQTGTDRLQVDRLIPGTYTVHFEEEENCVAPEPLVIHLDPNESSHGHQVHYRLGTGDLVLKYGTGQSQVYLDDVYFVITSTDGFSQTFPKGPRPTQDNHEGHELSILDVPVGEYYVRYDLDNDNGLFERQDQQLIEIKKDQITSLNQQLIPRFCTSHVVATFAKEGKPVEMAPALTLYDESGKLVQRAQNEELLVDGLFPGKYEVYFSHVDGYVTPDPVQFELRSGEESKKFVAKYLPSVGNVIVKYFTNAEGDYIDDIGFKLYDEKGVTAYDESIAVDDPSTGGKRVDLENLAVGRYTLVFDTYMVNGFLPSIPSKEIVVTPSQVMQVEQEIAPQYGTVEVSIALPPSKEAMTKLPEITLRNQDGEVEMLSLTGHLLKKSLIPGEYTIEFEKKDEFFSPQNQSITVLANSVVGPIIGDYSIATGSVEVTYSTGEQGDRLDEVSLWISDSRGIRRQFPNEDHPARVYSPSERSITIDYMASGDYKLEFFVPNADGLFEEAKAVPFTIEKGERIEIRQDYKPHYASFDAEISVPDQYRHPGLSTYWRLSKDHFAGLNTLLMALKQDHENPIIPMMSLMDSKGNVVETVSTKKAHFKNIVPGNYILSFGDSPFLLTPEPVFLEVAASANVGSFLGEYQIASGEIAVTFQTGDLETRLNEVDIILSDEEGNTVSLIEHGQIRESDKAHSRVAILSDLPMGTYTIQTKVSNEDGLFNEIPIQVVSLGKNETVELDKKFIPSYGSIDASYGFQPRDSQKYDLGLMTLKNAEGEIVAESSTGKLRNETLIPGMYTIEFDEMNRFYSPEPVNVYVGPGEFVGPVSADYQLAKGHIDVTYTTGPLQERLDRVRFWLIDENGERVMYPKGEEYLENAMTGERYVTIKDLTIGVYRIEWILPNHDNLFASVQGKSIVLEKDGLIEIKENIQTQYALLDVGYDFDYIEGEMEILPTITLRDSFGEIRASKAASRFVADNLPPGDYTVTFGDQEGYISPDPIKLTLIPNAHEGPIMAQYRLEKVSFAVKSNSDEAAWKLYKNGILIKDGKGTLASIDLPPGDGYYLEIDEVEGLSSFVDPGGTFALKAGQAMIAEVSYAKQFGFLNLLGTLPDGEILTVTLTSHERGGDTIRNSLHSKGGSVVWESKRVPVGTYTVSYEAPDYFFPVENRQITVHSNESYSIAPTLKSKRRVNVKTNMQDATFVLASDERQYYAEGMGSMFSFDDLIPGEYQLTFHEMGRKNYITPQKQKLIIDKRQDLNVEVAYEKAASLVVTSNVEQYTIKVTPLNVKGTSQEEFTLEEVSKRGKTLTLPEGYYRLSFLPLEGQMASSYGASHPDDVNVQVVASRPERVHAIYEASQGSLVVTSNIPNASYVIRDVSDAEGLVIGRFTGEYSVIPMTFTGKYEVVFEDFSNYITPPSVVVDVGSSQRQVIGGTYLPAHKVVKVDGGPAVIGDVFGEGADDELPARTVEIDTFSIGTYEVTNAQYAAWLNKVFAENRIDYLIQQGVRGQIKDKQGHILFETYEADSNSQILSKGSGENRRFVALEGRASNPVVEVSWYGADFYCKDNGYRLPTEAEWEKAASCAPSYGGKGSVKKYRYGCAQDSIDRTVANYMDSYRKNQSNSVQTFEVGFFNGINLLPQATDQANKIRSKPSLIDTKYGTGAGTSFYGAYDMSGNVREWTNSWYDPNSHRTMSDRNPQGVGHGNKKVVKGGCYDSFAYELRTSARLPLSPDMTDGYTGFRIVIDE